MPVTINGSGSISGVPGAVLQVVAGSTSTTVTTTSGTYIDTGLTATITPKSASSKILVFVTQSGVSKDGNTGVNLRLFRASTQIGNATAGYTDTTTSNTAGDLSLTVLDSPSTTASVTYKTQFAGLGSPFSGTAYVQRDSVLSTIILMEVAA